MTPITRTSVIAASLLFASCATEVDSTYDLTAAELSSVAGSITRVEILSRAQRWVDLAVPYSQNQSDAYSDGTGGKYRPDCSGYVAMAWHLAKKGDGWDFNTNDFGATSLKSYIAYDDLLEGDAILGVSYGHIVLFDRWVDAADSRIGVPNHGQQSV